MTTRIDGLLAKHGFKPKSKLFDSINESIRYGSPKYNRVILRSLIVGSWQLPPEESWSWDINSIFKVAAVEKRHQRAGRTNYSKYYTRERE